MTRWVRSEGVVCEQLDNATVLVDARSGRTWLLNSAAAKIWHACDGKLTRFGAESAAFCRQLAVLGLLAAEPAGRGQAVCFSGPAGPMIYSRSLGTGPRHRPSPRGLSGPG